MSKALFLKPLDVLYLRGNRLFGAAGDDAEAIMPPWPSVAAGAIRSRMLVDKGENPAAFAQGNAPKDPALAKSLGTPEKPGTFRLMRFCLARRSGEALVPLLPLPADWMATEKAGQEGEPATEEKELILHRLTPRRLPEGVMGSAETEMVPILRIAQEAKPVGGCFLNEEGLRAWLRDEEVRPEHIVRAEALWKTDPRLGIGMDAMRRTADTEQGRIYTSDAVALAKDVGFLAEVTGADGLLPRSGLARLGGDGRGAEVCSVSISWPEPDWDAIARTGRFRLLLTSPGLFAEGWRPPLKGARLVAAAVPRAEVISGWNLADHAPKPARRAAPTGSVYWYEGYKGDVEKLKQWVEKGLPCKEQSRRAEGFNACLIGNWNKEGRDV